MLEASSTYKNSLVLTCRWHTSAWHTRPVPATLATACGDLSTPCSLLLWVGISTRKFIRMSVDPQASPSPCCVVVLLATLHSHAPGRHVTFLRRLCATSMDPVHRLPSLVFLVTSMVVVGRLHACATWSPRRCVDEMPRVSRTNGNDDGVLRTVVALVVVRLEQL